MAIFQLSRFSSFRALSHRDFAYLWAGMLVSNIGTWMESVALGVYVTQVTGKAGWTGGVAALTHLPSLVLAPLGGALADRFDRRSFMAVCVCVQALLAALLTVLAATGNLSVPWVATISLLNGAFSTLSIPCATALTVAVVPQEDLHNALSLDSAQFNLGRIIGPVLAALVLTQLGIAGALFINTLSFLAVLLALARMHGAVRTPPRVEALWAGIVRGVKLAWTDPGIALALGTGGFVGLLISPFVGLVPVFALKVLGGDATTTSMLLTAQGTGAVLAAFSTGAIVARVGRRALLEGAMVLVGLCSAIFWLSPTLPVALGALFVLGAVYLVAFTGLKTVCQARTPPELQARVSSLFLLLVNMGYVLGVWGQGMLSDRLGVRPITAGAALLFFGIVVVTRALRPRGLATLEDVKAG
ncbi:MFS transporter [Corallococcus llansteffanensis]|uniref:MFS transporter n=1 Tax=Corallococcus llansteffanensis TaxID=2316731 RepID=A0A3A8NL97_9BACT|nr:MFS transporter [Corallococcus llansteffanensis]RKH45008.1 MFS transporter [Corallococcus llansteffanensis]